MLGIAATALCNSATNKAPCGQDDSATVRPAGQYTGGLDSVLKHDSRCISKLISCVGYPSNSSVQLEAIKLTQLLAARQPHLVDLLVQQKIRITPDGKHGTLLL